MLIIINMSKSCSANKKSKRNNKNNGKKKVSGVDLNSDFLAPEPKLVDENVINENVVDKNVVDVIEGNYEAVVQKYLDLGYDEAFAIERIDLGWSNLDF